MNIWNLFEAKDMGNKNMTGAKKKSDSELK